MSFNLSGKTLNEADLPAIDSSVSSGSTNPVQSGAVHTALSAKLDAITGTASNEGQVLVYSNPKSSTLSALKDTGTGIETSLPFHAYTPPLTDGDGNVVQPQQTHFMTGAGAATFNRQVQVEGHIPPAEVHVPKVALLGPSNAALTSGNATERLLLNGMIGVGNPMANLGALSTASGTGHYTDAEINALPTPPTGQTDDHLLRYGQSGQVLTSGGYGNPLKWTTVSAQVSSGTDAALIANGSVSNTEFQYLDGVTSSIQSQLDGKLGGTAGVAGTYQSNPPGNDAQLLKYSHPTGGTGSYTFAAIEDDGSNVDISLPLRVRDYDAASPISFNNPKYPFQVDMTGQVTCQRLVTVTTNSAANGGAVFNGFPTSLQGWDHAPAMPQVQAPQCLLIGQTATTVQGVTSPGPPTLLLNSLLGVGSPLRNLTVKAGQTNATNHYTDAEIDAVLAVTNPNSADTTFHDRLLRYGQSGQVLTSSGYGNPLKWTTVSSKAHGHATYLASGGGLNYNQNNTVSFTANSSWSLYDVSSITDTGYTSVTGMATTYTPVGVTFVPSTTAMTTAGGTTVTFSNNPVVNSNRITPSRWRIITAGHYNIRANVHMNDWNAGDRLHVHLWRRSGGSSQNAGTTVTLIGYQHTLQNTQYEEDFALNLNVEGIYQLSAFDEVYCSVNGDTSPGTYMQNLGTYFTIQQV